MGVNDLIVGLLLMLGLSVALFVVTLRLTRGRGRSRLRPTLIATGAVAVLLLHAMVLVDHVGMARVLPFTNLIVLGNISPLAVAVLAAAAWRALPGTALRRG